MDNGFVGIVKHIPSGYRCYIIFLPNETQLDGAAEQYIMRHFWEAASSVGPDVLFTGVVRGNGLSDARKMFGFQNPSESAIVMLDCAPQDWKKGDDPIARVPLAGLKSEYEVLEALHLLVRLSKEDNFIGRTNRRKTFKKVKEYLSYLPGVAGVVEIVIPG